MSRVTLLRAVVGVVVVAIGARAQTQESKAAAFDVVSIRLHKSLERGGSLKFRPGGRFEGTNVYVLALIAAAFRKDVPLAPAQIEGGPDWIRFDRYDMLAKAETRTGDESMLYQELPALLRPVLEDRFRLRVHWETRQLPIYALVLAGKDRRFGPQLRLTNCAARPETLRTNVETSIDNGRPLCEPSSVAAGSLDGHGISMLSLVSVLSSSLDRVVLDRTGLQGMYDLNLRWMPDSAVQSNADLNAPTLSTALQEQLGLKLESTKGSVDVLVIDHIERPAQD
jgi:uncharacterized protein (TIGR03435 family)